LAGCARGDRKKSVPPTLLAGAKVERVRVFLIARQDGGAKGRRVGCGDSAVPVEMELPEPRPALAGALAALLELRSKYHPASGFYDALYASPLQLAGIERHGPRAEVRLSGYLALDGECDGARALAQLTETARQFSDVRQVRFLLEGRPLAELLPPGR
jgi:sporulation and spore germination protein